MRTYVTSPTGLLFYKKDISGDRRKAPYELRYDNGEIVGYTQPPRQSDAPWERCVWGTPERASKVFPDLAESIRVVALIDRRRTRS